MWQLGDTRRTPAEGRPSSPALSPATERTQHRVQAPQNQPGLHLKTTPLVLICLH